MSYTRKRLGGREERSSLGDVHMQAGLNNLNILCARYMSAMAPWEKSREDTVKLLFPPNVLERAAAAFHLVSAASDVIAYPIAMGVNFIVNYRDPCNWPAIQPTALFLQEGSEALLLHIEVMRGIHQQFEECKYLLRWLNKNATPGAIRYYWPPILELCSNAPALADLQDTPSRFHTPPGIAEVTPMIRRTLATIAAARFLPTDHRSPSRDHLWLTFQAVSANVDGQRWQTEQRTYYL